MMRLKAAEQSASNRDSGMDDLFGDVVPSQGRGRGDVYAPFRVCVPGPASSAWQEKRRPWLVCVSGHPIDEYESEVRRFAPTRIAEVRPDKQGNQVLAGLIVATRTMKTKRGDTMAILQLDDRSARIEVTVYADTYAEHRELLAKDTIVIVEGSVANDDYSGGLSMRARVRSLLQARQDYASELTIEVSDEMLDPQLTDWLEKTLAGAGGGHCPVSLLYRQAGGKARVRAG